MDFIAIDFETASGKSSAPCSLGIVLVKNNIINERLSFLINPETSISPYNSKIHGITDNMVTTSPTFPEVWEQIKVFFQHYPVVAHNASFDLSVLEKAAKRYKINLPVIIYYCTLELYRINYPELSDYKLNDICNYFNMDLKNHHCCDDDSCAAAQLMIKLSNNEEAIVYGHTKYTNQNNYDNDYNSDDYIEKEYPESKYNKMFEDPVYEEAHTTYDNMESIQFEDSKFVITGDFEKYSRSDIQNIIESRGGTCSSSVSSKTDYLIVAYQNLKVIKNSEDVKSTKLIKAEELRTSGCKIKIISDENFIEIIERG